MSIEAIIEILDQLENKSIHRIYYLSAGWCYVTSKNGTRIKLQTGDSEEYVNEVILGVRLGIV